jgi:carbonic anhydrase
MPTCKELLQKNKQWSAQLKEKNPSFFKQLSKKQTPEFLWIGCSDSRVPAEIIVNAEPGDMFIHRNIANQVIHTDFNCLSVLQYAVSVLEIKHIIVCGHYGCGGIMAALNKQRSDLVITNKWLMHIKNTYRLHQQEIDTFTTESERVNRLVELNVIEQIHALSHTSIVQDAWKNHQRPTLHGWVYGLNDGLIDPLITLNPNDEINPIFQYQSISKA